MHMSTLMSELRRRLSAEDYHWYDASEEFNYGDDSFFHMERTKVMRGDIEIASCIYGYSGKKGEETGITHGWPSRIECWTPALGSEPVAATIDEILDALGEDAA